MTVEDWARALAKTLRRWRERALFREQVLAVLHELELSNDEAEAVIACGVALGIVLDDGSEVRAI